MSANTLRARRQEVRTAETPAPGMSKRPTIRIVTLALESLELLCQEARGLGVRELARAQRVGKSTAHRILQTLEARGMARQDNETGRYVVTAELVKMASLVQGNLEVRRVARPFMSAFEKRCRETVFLGVLDSAEVVIVDRIDSAEPLRMSNDIGVREPVHSTALGKALLAGLEEEDVESLLRGVELKALTPKTTTAPEALKSELRRVRLSGFAIDDEETLPGVRCVGASIRDASGRVVAAVSASGPSLRITPERIPSLAQDVRATADSISNQLGFHGERATIRPPEPGAVHVSN